MQEQVGSPRILILGARGEPRGVALSLGSEFEARGFHACYENELKGSSTIPGLLRVTLRRFREQTPDGECYVHPGLSDWGHRPELVTYCNELGIVALAPSARVLTLFGNRLSLLEFASGLGMRTLISEGGPYHSFSEVERLLNQESYSFPIVLKSCRGDPTLATLTLQDREDFYRRVPLWMEQLHFHLGEVMVFCEKAVEDARLISVPFARFMDGRFETFAMVDSSLRVGHRRILDIALMPTGLDLSELKDSARLVGSSCGFVGVGSFDFLVSSQGTFLVGGKAGLDPAFRLWEGVAQTCAIDWQLAALGKTISTQEIEMPVQRPEAPRFGLQLTLQAWDTWLGFPKPGTIAEVVQGAGFESPSTKAFFQFWIRSSQHIRYFDEIPLGSLTVFAPHRSEAFALARGMLRESWISGSLATTEGYALEVLEHPFVSEGIYHAGFLDEEFVRSTRDLPLFVGLLDAVCEELLVGLDPKPGYRPIFRLSREGGGGAARAAPRSAKNSALPLQWKQSPIEVLFENRKGISGSLCCPELGDPRVCFVPVSPASGDLWHVRLGLHFFVVRRSWVSSQVSDVAESKLAVSRIRALTGGRVYSILYQAGAVVPAHSVFLLIESMGVLVPHAVAVPIRISKWYFEVEEEIPSGIELVEFEVVAEP